MNEHVSKVIEYMQSPAFQNKYTIEISRGVNGILELDGYLFSVESSELPVDEFIHLKSLVRKAKLYGSQPEMIDQMNRFVVCSVIERKTNKIIGFGNLKKKSEYMHDENGRHLYLSRFLYLFMCKNHRRRGGDIGVSDVIVQLRIREVEDPAIIAYPNEKSVRLLKRHGFREGRCQGTLKKLIYIKDKKFEQLLDY